MKPYTSHIPTLVKALAQTQGSILELGVGWYSTPLFNAFAAEGRYARSIDTNREWHARFHHFHDGVTHDVWLSLDHFNDVRLDDVRWSVVLIDGEVASRAPQLLRVREIANFVLLHDAESPAYSCEESIKTYRYRSVENAYGPRTAILSNYYETEWLCREPNW